MAKKINMAGFKGVGAEILTFNDRNSIQIKILEAELTEKIIQDKKTKKDKTVDMLKCKVVDLLTGKELGWSTIAKRLIEKLQVVNDSNGLIGIKLSIEKVGYGFNTQWNVNIIPESK